MGQERRRDALWLPATSSFASCGKRSRAERQTWPARRGSSFPAGRSKTTSFLSSRCTPFVTFCNFKCSDCVNHVQFFPTNAEEFPESGNAFTERFISESRRGLPYPRRWHHERTEAAGTSGPCTGVFDSHSDWAQSHRCRINSSQPGRCSRKERMDFGAPDRPTYSAHRACAPVGRRVDSNRNWPELTTGTGARLWTSKPKQGS